MFSVPGSAIAHVERNVTELASASHRFESFVESYQERFTADMAAHWKGRFGDVGKTCGRLGAHPGCRLDEVFQRGDGGEWLFLQYLWPHGPHVIAFESGTRLVDRSIHEPQLDVIAESLRLHGLQ